MAQRKKKSRLFGQLGSSDDDLSARMMMGATQQSIGADLRAARLARGESTADVAHQLCLRESYIQAIEEGDFTVLPGVVYAVGFLRSYARYLRLDADSLIQRFKEEVSEIPPPADLPFFEPSTESRVPRGGLVAFAILLAVVAYAGWYYLSTRDMTMADLVPAVPEQFAGLLSSPERAEPAPPSADITGLEPPGPGGSADSASGDEAAVDGAPPAPDRLTANQSAPGLGPSTAPEANRAPPQAQSSQVTAAADGAASSSGGPVALGEDFVDSRITLRATGDSWVQVRAADDTLLMTRIMRAGDSYRVPNQPGLKLMTGNAGELEILVDGEVVPAIGPAGSVKRNVLLDPARLKAGSAVVN